MQLSPQKNKCSSHAQTSDFDTRFSRLRAKKCSDERYAHNLKCRDFLPRVFPIQPVKHWRTYTYACVSSQTASSRIYNIRWTSQHAMMARLLLVKKATYVVFDINKKNNTGNCQPTSGVSPTTCASFWLSCRSAPRVSMERRPLTSANLTLL